MNVNGPTIISETSVSILELILSFPGALLFGNLCIIRLISSGVTGQQNILYLQGFGQYFLKSNCPTSLSDWTQWTQVMHTNTVTQRTKRNIATQRRVHASIYPVLQYKSNESRITEETLLKHTWSLLFTSILNVGKQKSVCNCVIISFKLKIARS